MPQIEVSSFLGSNQAQATGGQHCLSLAGGSLFAGILRDVIFYIIWFQMELFGNLFGEQSFTLQMQNRKGRFAENCRCPRLPLAFSAFPLQRRNYPWLAKE